MISTQTTGWIQRLHELLAFLREPFVASLRHKTLGLPDIRTECPDAVWRLRTYLRAVRSVRFCNHAFGHVVQGLMVMVL